MRHAAFFASLAAVLAGTAVAGPHGPMLPLHPAPTCCAEPSVPAPALDTPGGEDAPVDTDRAR